MIVVTGASGQFGRLVIEQLKGTAHVVAAARSPEKVRDLGVEVREFDYDRPETLDLDGADKVLLVSGSELGKRVRQHGAVVDAAKRAGVGLLVYTSAPRADTTELAVAPEHKATEQLILDSGLPYTFLRNGWYHENYLDGIATGAQTGEIVGSAGSGRVASAARADYAAAAAHVLTSEGHEKRIYELSGDTAWTFAELAQRIAGVAGRPVEYRSLSREEHQALLVDSGLPAEVASFVATLDKNIADGLLADTSGTLRDLIGRPTTPIDVTIRQVLGK
jgi:NAD(P)H dehydrogenase (quinone)